MNFAAYQESLSAFRLGDVRGVYPDDINESFAFEFAQAFTSHFAIKGRVATGRDIRSSSKDLQDALNAGFLKSGIDVIDLGLCTTELGYFASTQDDIEAAIVVTASHNPAKFNGFKCVLAQGEAVGYDSGLADVKALMLDRQFKPRVSQAGSLSERDYRQSYIDYLRGQFSAQDLAGPRIALNGLNGTAITLAGDIASQFEIPVRWFRKEPGPIPSQGADPVDPKLLLQMTRFMQSESYALGITWDGDCDRCVFFDPDGQLIPTYYVIGLLAEQFLKAKPGGAIVFDAKLRWNTLDVIRRNGGKAIRSPTGHVFMKRLMKHHGAVYGGELSSHHYFGSFFHCDSGMFAWLTMLELIKHHKNTSGASIVELIEARRRKISCTPEISLKLSDPDRVFQDITAAYSKDAISVDNFDGISLEMPGDWRFNLCRSKTEDLVRLNMESIGRGDELLEHGRKLLSLIAPFKADEDNWQAMLKLQ